ncbi:putative protease Do-like 14 isoform X2 [Cryptomeria japonica]|uniref:putative protease Do-like 14 isoform X2 n=1 Tax=Cryptomeria japonica TaxID=3369 RepID=UPI0027DA2E41|nr:putative protease Do-like 14 isoform X2 [Cryptomeria japonica]
MAFRLLAAFRRGVSPFSSKYQTYPVYKPCGFSKYSRKRFGKVATSVVLLAAASIGALWPERSNEIAVNLSPQLHCFLKDLWQKKIEYNYQSATLTDISTSVDWCRRFIIDKLRTSSQYLNSFQADSQNGVDTGPDSKYLTRSSIADAAAKVAPAVVNLTMTQGHMGLFLGRSTGSGTIINSNGIILTNAHVIADLTSGGVAHKGKITVTLQDGRSFEGKVINADFQTDIAIIKIYTNSPLPVAKLGSSSKLRAGDWVIALGSPLFLHNTVTAGIVSCVDRKSSELGLGGRSEYLQTDCPLNEGNSGGPLVNLDGEVVGVNTLKLPGADGMAFAIPIDSAIKIVQQFNKHGRVVRPWLGMKMLDLNELIVSQLKERDPSFPDVVEGVLVPQVVPGSPADRAGIRTGDVVIQFDGKPIKSVKQIVEMLGDNVGVAFKIVVKRASNLQVTLTIVPEEISPNF